jgi:hypothetical protein
MIKRGRTSRRRRARAGPHEVDSGAEADRSGAQFGSCVVVDCRTPFVVAPIYAGRRNRDQSRHWRRCATQEHARRGEDPPRHDALPKWSSIRSVAKRPKSGEGSRSPSARAGAGAALRSAALRHIEQRPDAGRSAAEPVAEGMRALAELVTGRAVSQPAKKSGLSFLPFLNRKAG